MLSYPPALRLPRCWCPRSRGSKSLRFYLVDRIDVWYPGVRAEGVKGVTRTNEVSGDGMPSTLVVEGMAQLSSYLLGDTLLREGRQALSLMTMIDRLEFGAAVYPGEQLQLYANLIARRAEGARMAVRATVQDRMVCQGVLGFAFFEAETPQQAAEFQWTRDLLYHLTAGCREGDPPCTPK